MGAKIYDSTSASWKDAETPKIYVGSAFADSKGMSYNGSEWVEDWGFIESPFYLFNKGIQNIPYTAKFNYKVNGSGPYDTSYYWMADYYLDLTNYNTLKVNITYNSAYNCLGWSIHTSTSDFWNKVNVPSAGWPGTGGSPSIASIDISSLSGNYYVGFGINQSYSGINSSNGGIRLVNSNTTVEVWCTVNNSTTRFDQVWLEV